MLNQIVNRLRGQVYVRVEAPFPERVLNLCGARNLAFWDLEWETPETFTCRVTRQHWRLLRRAAENVAFVDAALAVTVPAGQGRRLIERIEILRT